ncbi:MAG: hypothetical protein ACE5JP_13385, partial [Candidatus Bipolaricaulia bacterium]
MIPTQDFLADVLNLSDPNVDPYSKRNPRRFVFFYKLSTPYEHRELQRSYIDYQDLNRAFDHPEMEIYFCPNLFWKPRTRRKQELSYLNALVLDLDLDLEDPDHEYWIETIIDRCHELGIPEPHYIVFSGTGYHVYWLIDPIRVFRDDLKPGGRIPFYEDVLKKLQRMFEDLGADPGSTDAVHVFRVPGTLNHAEETGEGIFTFVNNRVEIVHRRDGERVWLSGIAEQLGGQQGHPQSTVRVKVDREGRDDPIDQTEFIRNLEPNTGTSGNDGMLSAAIIGYRIQGLAGDDLIAYLNALNRAVPSEARVNQSRIEHVARAVEYYGYGFSPQRAHEVTGLPLEACREILQFVERLEVERVWSEPKYMAPEEFNLRVLRALVKLGGYKQPVALPMSDLAESAGVSYSTLRKRVGRGNIPFIHRGKLHATDQTTTNRNISLWWTSLSLFLSQLSKFIIGSVWFWWVNRFVGGEEVVFEELRVDPSSRSPPAVSSEGVEGRDLR